MNAMFFVKMDDSILTLHPDATLTTPPLSAELPSKSDVATERNDPSWT